MLSLISLEDRIHLREEAFGTTRDRMLRELTGALEVLSAETPIVPVFEDLHWSDPSTIDLLTAIEWVSLKLTHYPARLGKPGKAGSELFRKSTPQCRRARPLEQRRTSGGTAE